MKITFIYLFNESTIEFNIHHYISIRSNLVLNDLDATIWTNQVNRLKGNKFIKSLLSEFPKFSVESVSALVDEIRRDIGINIESIPYMAHSADILRLKILHDCGGVYSDVDSVALRPYDNLLKLDKDVFCFEQNNSFALCNGIFIAKKDSNLIKDWYENYANYRSEDCLPGTPDWTKFSVAYGSKIIRNYRSEVEIIDSSLFQPYYLYYSDVEKLFFLDDSQRLKNFNSICIHLWETRHQPILKVLSEDYFNYSNATYAKIGKGFLNL